MTISLTRWDPLIHILMLNLCILLAWFLVRGKLFPAFYQELCKKHWNDFIENRNFSLVGFFLFGVVGAFVGTFLGDVFLASDGRTRGHVDHFGFNFGLVVGFLMLGGVFLRRWRRAPYEVFWFHLQYYAFLAFFLFLAWFVPHGLAERNVFIVIWRHVLVFFVITVWLGAYMAQRMKKTL